MKYKDKSFLKYQEKQRDGEVGLKSLIDNYVEKENIDFIHSIKSF